MTDLVTFGETMLRLSAPRGHRLERTDALEVHVGGAESNVAVAAAALGADATWLSALPDSPLGRRVTRDLVAQGVEVAVHWSNEGRVGTYYIDRGGAPRGTNVVYDRGETPIRSATRADLEADRVRDAAVFFTSGITPALSETASETTASLLEAAREAGTTTAFDVNYRSKLWSPEAARSGLEDLFEHVDWLVVAERDARTVLDIDAEPDEQARRLAAEYGFETVVITRGEDGALALADGETYAQPAFAADTVDPIGTGDAFVGGFLAARIEGEAVPSALEYGGATAALKRTVEGDLAIVTREEVERVVEGSSDRIDR